jgi:hypothetical protein
MVFDIDRAGQRLRRVRRLLLVFPLAAIPTLLVGGSIWLATMDPVARIVSNAKGNHPASELPKMCVNAHVATATAAKTVALLKTLGISCARIDWNWNVLERDLPGKYDWNGNTLSDPSGPVSFSSFFSTICGAGIQPIFIATYNNPLYSTGVFTTISDATNIDGYKNFGAALAKQAAALNCLNPIIEAFNEPNLTIWTSGMQWSGSDYATVLRAFSAAVKATQANVMVYSGGVSPGGGTMPIPWIKQMVSTDETFPNVDSYAVHPYNFTEPPHPLPTPLPDQILLDLKAFQYSSGRSKPISITEYGFPYNSVDSNLDKQGIYLGWAMLDAIVAGVTHFASYDLVDDGVDYKATGENTFGLFFNGAASAGRPLDDAVSYGLKPSGTAFKSVTAAMASSRSYKVGYDNAAQAVRIAFQKAEGTTFAIWTTDAATPKSYVASLGRFSSVTCKDLLGRQVSCSFRGDKLSVTLTTSAGPIIVTALH